MLLKPGDDNNIVVISLQKSTQFSADEASATSHNDLALGAGNVGGMLFLGSDMKVTT